MLRAHSAHELPDDMLRQWKRWETGRVKPIHYTSIIASMFGTVSAAIFDDDRPPLPPMRQADANSALIAVSGMDTLEIVDRLRRSDVSHNTLEALRFKADQLCCEYPYTAPQDLRVEGREWLSRLTRLLDGHLTLAQHREVLEIAGWLSLLVGCVEYDTADARASEATRVAALQLGEEAGDSEVVAWAHEMHAWRALTQGSYQEAIAAARTGREATRVHSVAVQLAAQEAKAWARMGERRMVETTLEQGRLLLDALPYPEHPEHHFVVDPDKFDFYAMDCYRHVGESTLAEMHAQEIIRKGTAPDGTERAPMRIAEAHATLGVMAARRGDLDGALSSGNAAIHGPRRSLPTLLMVASELSNEMAQVSSTAAETHNFREQLRALAHSA